MSIKVDIRGAWEAPVVTVASDLVGRNSPWQIERLTYFGEAAIVRGAIGSGPLPGGAVTVVDVLAPLSELLTYRFIVDGAVVETYGRYITVRRGDGVHVSAVESIDALTTAAVNNIGTDSLSFKPRFQRFDIPGKTTPILRLESATYPMEGESRFASVEPDSTKMEKILSTNQPIILLHDHAVCSVWNCKIPTTRIVMPSDVRVERAEDRFEAKRLWQFNWVVSDDPLINIASGGGTWDAFDAERLTWDAFDAKKLTWSQFDGEKWGNDA